MASRPPIPKSLQVAVFRRDRWLCLWCNKPVIFAPAMNILQQELRPSETGDRLAYYHAHWTREGAPLLDLLGAVIDHKESLSGGGLGNIENLATACNKCNGHKGAKTPKEWAERLKERTIKGKYGEPQIWDGFSTLFVHLAQRHKGALSPGDRVWLKALRSPQQAADI
jgi:5-methylcytosine-specific restriction endonuclease McrA